MTAATGWSQSGMNAIGKKMPDRNMSGNWTTLASALAVSSVRA